MNHPENEIYEYYIECRLEDTEPEALLKTMTRLLEMNRNLDYYLTKPFGNISTSDMRIVDMSSGSLRARLCTVLKMIPDELISLTVESTTRQKIAYGLIKLKETAIKKLEEPNQNANDFLKLTDDLNQTAKKCDLVEEDNDIFNDDDTILILSELKKTSELKKEKFADQDISFISADNKTPIRSSDALNSLDLDALQIADEKEISGNAILRIKKSIFVGQAKWDFQYEKHTISANILDGKWLERYHNREISLLPGDALEVELIGTLHFNKTGLLLKETYLITKVHRVIADEEILPIGKLM